MAKIIGLFVEKYIGKGINGSNCDFEYFDQEMIRYHFMIVRNNNTKCIFTMEKEEGECGSGWCCASWVNTEIENVDKFPTYNYVPKQSLEIDFEFETNNELREFTKYINNDDHSDNIIFKKSNDCKQDLTVFEFSYIGYDSYYPGGDMNVNMDLFRPLKRLKAGNKRPVWIVDGESGLGKTTIFNEVNLNGKFKVFETDKYEELPEKINENIIIIGNRKCFSIDEILKRIPENSYLVKINFLKF